MPYRFLRIIAKFLSPCHKARTRFCEGKKSFEQGSSTPLVERFAKIPRATTRSGCRNNARGESTENRSYKADLLRGGVDIYDAQLRRILIKLRYTDPVYDGTVPGASQARKEGKKKRAKKRQPRSFHAKWRFRSTGITLNLRIGRTGGRRGEETEKDRQEGMDG